MSEKGEGRARQFAQEMSFVCPHMPPVEALFLEEGVEAPDESPFLYGWLSAKTEVHESLLAPEGAGHK